MGLLQSRLGNLQGAAERYRSASAIRADCFEFHYNLAATLHALRQYEEAVRSYREALRIRPDDSDTLYSLGVALQKVGDPAAAARSYGNVL